MRPESRTFLADAKVAAQEILEFGGESGQLYLASRRDALAVERLFEVLGEALYRIRSIEPALLDELTDSPAIIGMRNVIAHGYDAIEPRRVAETIQKRVPALILELQSLLDDD